MPSLIALSVTQNNDVLLTLSVTEADGVTAQDLTDYTPPMIVKGSAYADDASGTTLGVGTGLTMVSETGGTLTALLTHEMLAQPVPLWYRLDLTDGLGNRTTSQNGPITVSPA